MEKGKLLKSVILPNECIYIYIDTEASIKIDKVCYLGRRMYIVREICETGVVVSPASYFERVKIYDLKLWRRKRNVWKSSVLRVYFMGNDRVYFRDNPFKYKIRGIPGGE